ncbi:MAG: ATP-binding protein [Bacteroidota bacterium]
MSIRFQLFAAFFSLVLIFIADFFVNQGLSTEVIRNSSYVNRSESVIRNSNMLQKNIIEMQGGFRGFLLTGKETFLKQYYEGLENVPELLKEERTLVSANHQRAKLDSIARLNAVWVKYANALISTKKDTLPEATEKYNELFETKLKMEVGKNLNERIQRIFTEFDNYEYGLRSARRSALRISVVNTRNINLGLTLFSVFLAFSLGMYFIRNITRRIKKMVDLAENISMGDFKQVKDTTNDEMNKLSISLNSMSRTLEKNITELTKKNKDLDEFAYVVSHDLKAPLRGISNIISWIEEDHTHDLTKEVKHNLGLITDRTVRLENMINGLLEYARIGKTKKAYERIQVKEMVREIAEMIVPKNYIVNLDIRVQEMYTEKVSIEQVLSNLISNAVKHNTNQQPRIDICAIEQIDHFEFSVTDNGQGIHEKYFDKIFQIFQTLKERDAFESTGIGLAIVKRIIEEYKGTIKVKSELGTGSTFVFTWPKNN